jgi:hypothetical protein
MKPMEVGFHRDTPFRLCREDDPQLLLWNKVVEKLCTNYPHKKEIEVMSGPPAFHCRYSHFFGVKDGVLQTVYIENDQMPYVDELGLNPMNLDEVDKILE